MLVVDVDPEVAVQRLVAAPGHATRPTPGPASPTRSSRDERLAVADLVIDNSGTVDDLAAQVDEVWAWLRRAASAERGVDAAAHSDA